MTNNPWDMKDTPWRTEAAFWAWVRGQLRKGWMRHPVKHLFVKQNRFKSQNRRGKMTWHLVCASCEKQTPQTEIHVDHKNGWNSFTKKSDIAEFVQRLYFVTYDDLQILCIPCHKIKTYQERMQLDKFSDAAIHLEAKQVMKKNTKELKTWLENHGEEYLTPKPKNFETVLRILKDDG